MLTHSSIHTYMQTYLKLNTYIHTVWYIQCILLQIFKNFSLCRFVFAINCGSEKQIQKIPILNPQSLDQQLNLVMRWDILFWKIKFTDNYWVVCMYVCIISWKTVTIPEVYVYVCMYVVIFGLLVYVCMYLCMYACMYVSDI